MIEEEDYTPHIDFAGHSDEATFARQTESLPAENIRCFLEATFLLRLPCSLLRPRLARKTSHSRRSTRLIPFGGQILIQGDINRDGYPDLLIGLSDSLNIYTYKSDGKGNYVDWTIPTTFCPALPLAMGDLQRNGNNDLLVSGYLNAPCANANNAGFANYANNGHGIYQPLNRYVLEPYPLQGAVLADFNSDKKLDMVSIRGPWLELEYGTGIWQLLRPIQNPHLCRISGQHERCLLQPYRRRFRRERLSGCGVD